MRVIRLPDTTEFNQSINEPNSRLVKPDPIPVYLWNSRSLVNKLKNFNSFTLTSNYKIYGITETWLSDHIYNNEIFPPNCTIYRKDRSSRGGGVMLEIDMNIPSKLLTSPDDIEVVTVEILTSKPCKICQSNFFYRIYSMKFSTDG